MRLCLPTDRDAGLESPLCGHFGSAPYFCVVDTESRECRTLPNPARHHEHGRCRPFDALRDEALDGIVVSGIGEGAYRKLKAAGLKVFRAEASTVKAAVDAFRAGRLAELDPGSLCAHGHDV